AVHAARGTNDTRGGTGDTGIIFREKAVVDIDASTAGVGLNVAGLRTRLISTDEAKVTIAAKGDAVKVIADNANASDVNLSKGAFSYTEFSGKTQFTVTMGNCGFRNQVTIDTSAEAVKSALYNKPTSVEFIVKGYAKVDVTAPGQSVYLRNDGAKNDAEVVDVVTLKVTENGSLKITNIGPASNGQDYQCIQINTDDANVIIDGGSIEMIKGCDESTLADGKNRVGIMSVPTTTKYTIGANATTYVFGKDAENAKTQTKVQAGAYYGKIAFAENTSVKYVASNFNDMGLDFFTLNNKTSDVNVLPFAAMSVLALVGLAAVVVLRKKFN
ncbi:MAG: hypothetical protein IJC19_02710, partial [Clostridia bacterium]|nr:hypothetical protein [Clostridia bacterium]